jgi:hypothetical protein
MLRVHARIEDEIFYPAGGLGRNVTALSRG